MPRDIRLWGRRSSFHVRKVIWTLQELGLAFSLTEAGHGIAPTPEFVARNPSALAPVIDDGGVVVWESNVIVRYLCSAYSPGALAADASLATRAQAEQWMDWNATTLWPALRQLHHAAVRGEPLDDRERRLAELDRWLDVLEARLAAHAFLAGGTFTMADIPAGLTVERAARLGLISARLSLAAWVAGLAARPAFPPEPADR